MEKETVDLGKFPAGKNDVAKETALPEGALREALNVDIDNEGNIRLRQGFEKIYSGSNIRSLYKGYFAEGGMLRHLNADNTATDVVAVDSQNRIDYCEINDRTYCTDGENNWVLNGIQAEPLGIVEPLGVPNAQPVTGSLQAGRYLMTVAYRNVVTGETSGCPNASPGHVAQGTGVRFFNIPQPISADYETVVYMSDYDGNIMFEQVSVPFGVTEVVVSSIRVDTSSCTTLHLTQMPSGHFIEYYRGKMYIAQDNVLWYSKAMYYGACRKATNFFTFAKRITVLIAVDNGVFIVADRTYFLSFEKTAESNLVELSHDTAVEGTAISVSGMEFGLETELDVAFWMGSTGAMLGIPAGVQGAPLINLTDDTLALKDLTDAKGSSTYKEYNGIKQVVSSVEQSGVPGSSLAAQDSATLTIIRNGVEIQ